MEIADLHQLLGTSALDCSICIVGSGPAGLTIATELANTQHDVLVIESGSRSREEPFAAGLNEIESVGAPRILDQSVQRNRILGGSSHSWSGRCARLDPFDFDVRDWVCRSGWPITAEELAPYADKTCDYLGLMRDREIATQCEDARLTNWLGLRQEAGVRGVCWQFSRSSSIGSDYVRFGSRFAKLSASNVRVITNATVTNIATTNDGRLVRNLEISTPEGETHQVRGRFFVLACGGIENPRMMLASNRVDPRGIGNGRGLVGRFLMDHPRVTLGTFAAENIPVVQRVFGLFRLPSGARFQRGLSLAPDIQRRERLLNCAAWTTQHVAEDDVWRTLRACCLSPGSDRLSAGLAVCKNANQVIAGLWNKYLLGRPLKRKFTRLDLDVMVEQVPDPESRIRLSERKDALGVPLSQIDWKIGEMERRTAGHLGNAIYKALVDAGLPTPVLVDWVREQRPEHALFSDVAHPAGATRMADSECDGVVDRNCKVFGIDNLYVAGSSVFPTCGHANPTLTIVTLALRLADRLRSERVLTSAAE